MNKRCTKCKEDKPLAEFPKHRRMPMGVYSACKACKAVEATRYRAANAAAVRRRSLDWYNENRERARATLRRWHEENPHMRPMAWDRWYAENRDAVLQRKRLTRDPVKGAHHSSMRRARIRSAVPPWADLEAIQAFYLEARRMTLVTGEQWVVDHVIPLKHPLVSGLHVETNLRVIPYLENARKGNRWRPGEVSPERAPDLGRAVGAR